MQRFKLIYWTIMEFFTFVLILIWFAFIDNLSLSNLELAIYTNIGNNFPGSIIYNWKKSLLLLNTSCNKKVETDFIGHF